MVKQKNKIFGKIVPFLLVFAVTMALFMVMKRMKPEIDKKPAIAIVPTVSVTQIEPIDYAVPIISEGMVTPKTSIAFSSEISGQITAVSSRFVIGGQFQKGDVLISIDPKDYQLAITKAQANVSAQEANLDLEQAKSDLAKNDWQKYGKKGTPSALNLNLPQVASAKAALAGARADLLLARRNLEKASIIAPFDGVVLSKNVDVGQFVTMGTMLANIASIEVAEIRVALSDRQLIDGGFYKRLSDISVNITSSEAQGNQWQGKVAQIEAQRDAQTLMNFVVIEVQRPFTQQNLPLRFNTFVDVHLTGRLLSGVFPVSRHLMTLDQQLNVLDESSRLQVHQVSLGHADDDMVYITEGLAAGDQVITTQLSGLPVGTLLTAEQ